MFFRLVVYIHMQGFKWFRSIILKIYTIFQYVIMLCKPFDVISYLIWISDKSGCVYTVQGRIRIRFEIRTVQFCLRGDFFDNWETCAQKYRDALRKTTNCVVFWNMAVIEYFIGFLAYWSHEKSLIVSCKTWNSFFNTISYNGSWWNVFTSLLKATTCLVRLVGLCSTAEGTQVRIFLCFICVIRWLDVLKEIVWIETYMSTICILKGHSTENTMGV